MSPKNGFGDMVILSMEAYDNMQFQSEVYLKLKEAEMYAQTIGKTYSSKEVLKELKKVIE